MVVLSFSPLVVYNEGKSCPYGVLEDVSCAQNDIANYLE